MQTQDLAELSSKHYDLTGTPTKKQIADFESRFEGYKVDKRSDHNVLGMYNYDRDHLVINHLGTDKPADVLSDLIQATPLNRLDPQADSRRKKTKDIINHYPNTKRTTLTGHSYGGATVLDALSKSPSLEKHVTDVHLFNPYISKPHKKNKKVTVHRTPNDLVSILPTPFKTMTHKTSSWVNPHTAHGLENFMM